VKWKFKFEKQKSLLKLQQNLVTSKLEYILRVPRREVKRGVVSEKRLIHAYFIKSSDLSNFEKA